MSKEEKLKEEIRFLRKSVNAYNHLCNEQKELIQLHKKFLKDFELEAEFEMWTWANGKDPDSEN